MPQFAVHRNPNRATRDSIPLLLDVQNDLLEELSTRVVIPLYKPAAVRHGIIERLMPSVEIGGETYVVVTPELAGVPQSSLGAETADVSDHRAEIIAALDFLVTGI